ncbi:anti-phage deoxyguanosine triphosphatase [Glaciecola sp. KUL10]|uniref:anti-phage deoxyguanosine triphosphatase n=1 Tax=Glaciecola sp. (strain KUL10) TaxID=2161813 RepID=UPI000D783E4D|nr:anti-phage deoxyguanosine triphosphatase [Glaciecola sp. KUL10]GBL03024.1 deoxyguanosinetriphosphate triphosphohydrolase-like protein [Glaciecola sp. KUL10]
MHANSSIWTERRHQRPDKGDGDLRDAFQRDKARVMHSASFRRLQAKTQVVGIGINDFYRTRLTHSLEAAQIGTGIVNHLCKQQPDLAAKLQLNEHLIESLCLAHDIGHPPFGHGGEVAMHYMMSDHGGFEGNAQTFRIISKLEPYSKKHGMNLARRTALGLIKYPNYIDNLLNPSLKVDKPINSKLVKAYQWHPPKGLYQCDEDSFDWLLSPIPNKDKDEFMSVQLKKQKHHNTHYKSLDCSIMELADDIAYGIHDLEDAVATSMVSQSYFIDEVVKPIESMQLEGLSTQIQTINTQLFSGDSFLRKSAVGALVNYFITCIFIDKQDVFESDLLDYQAKFPFDFAKALTIFKQFVFKHVIKKPELQLQRYKGQQMIMALFEAFSTEPMRLLPVNTVNRWEKAEELQLGQRIIADYISGMTDEYASRIYGQLFLPYNGLSLSSLA